MGHTVEGGGVTVALKKSDLYSSPWAGADELRSGMDASQHKDYLLTTLWLVKYVSDKAKADEFADVEVPEGGSFDDLAALIGIKPPTPKSATVDVTIRADSIHFSGGFALTA